jgi:hypothetical protein
MAEVERRRRRLRRPNAGQAPLPAPPPARPVPGPPPSVQTSPVHDPDEEQPGNGDERETERGLRGLVGSGSSQVSLSAALRARDAARPDDAELAAAGRDLVIVRRGWVPREDLPRSLR